MKSIILSCFFAAITLGGIFAQQPYDQQAAVQESEILEEVNSLVQATTEKLQADISVMISRAEENIYDEILFEIEESQKKLSEEFQLLINDLKTDLQKETAAANDGRMAEMYQQIIKRLESENQALEQQILDLSRRLEALEQK